MGKDVLAEQRRLIVAGATPRLTRYIPHRPTPHQAAFLLVPVPEAFYGGAAGGGKSDALLMAALQYVDVPGYAALLVRETFQMLNQPGGLMTRAMDWLRGTDATWNSSDHQWTFPSGATLTFRHLAETGAERNFQGSEYHYIGIDEVTDLTEETYRFLFSRLRRGSESRIPIRMRSASNPHGAGLDWVHRRFVIEGQANGRVFIQAFLEDNPHLDQEAYEESLHQLGPLTYRQLRHGDWTVRPSGGYFKIEHFDHRFIDPDAVPGDLALCRYWDLAASEPRKGRDPDHTAGVLLGKTREGISYVLDVKRTRSTPLTVEKLVARTAEADAAWARDREIDLPKIRIEQEPGSAGLSVIDHYRRSILAKFDVKGVRSTGSKETRAAPVAARAEASELWICHGPWNTEFLDELISFPAGSHDDQVDALSGAYGELAEHRESFVPMPILIPRSDPWPDWSYH